MKGFIVHAHPEPKSFCTYALEQRHGVETGTLSADIRPDVNGAQQGARRTLRAVDDL